MKVTLNTNVFMVDRDKTGKPVIPMTQEFDELAETLSVVLKKWNEVLFRNNATATATKESIQRLANHAAALSVFCDNTVAEAPKNTDKEENNNDRT